jgi:glycine cleavage system aminomethyltransferase T
MSRAFLTPLAGPGSPARSPLADAAAATGGRLEVRDGWELAASFGDLEAEATACIDSVGFADRSSATKLELQGPAAHLTSVAGTLEPGTARREDDVWRCPVAPQLRIELSPVGSGSGAERRHALETGGVRVCDLTAALAAISIWGPAAGETIARFCALDLRPAALPTGGFRPGSIARTPGYLLRERPDGFLLLFGAAYGEYLWEQVAAAATALGGRPVGADAPAKLEEVSNA